MADSTARVSRMFGVASLVLGVAALIGRLGFEASRADVGSDLALDALWIRVVLHFGSLVLALFGVSNALAAAVTSRTWSGRVGLPLPGLLVNGMALLWFALWT